MTAVAVAAPTRFARSLPAALDALVTVRDTLTAALAGRGWSTPEAFRVLVCADEAVANAATHGAGMAGTVHVTFEVDDDHASLTVRDRRPCPTLPKVPAVPRTSSEHGRGLILMHALADELAIEPGPDGTSVAVTVNRSFGGTT
jgi:serine/threonine-protein kinase RsbW